ncbi:M20/M25/M40 family metallo-hydrolase [soil metagenome]
MSVLDLHADLARFGCLSHDEKPIADFVERYLHEATGGAAEFGRTADNIWASLGEGDDLLLLNSHLDVVPPSADHPHPPFEPTRVGDRIYGRGTVDAKASGVAMLQAFVDLARSGFKPKSGRLVVALTACEEAGRGYNGMQHLREDLFGKALPSVKAAIVGEPTALRPCLAQKGLLILTCNARGRAAHAARPHLGENALFAAARDLLALESFSFDREDDLLGLPTITPTVISGGSAKNVVPEACAITLDIRSTPAYTHAELTEIVSKALIGEVKVYSDRLIPCRTDPSERIARAAARALTDLSMNAEPFGSPTASDWIFLHDIPTVKIGPGDSRLSHTAQENVRATEVEKAVEVYRAIAQAYFAGLPQDVAPGGLEASRR